MRKLPNWLADPLGPLSIPPAYLPKLLPWLFRFWRAGAPRQLRGEPRRAGRADEARRSRMDGADGPLRHAAACCARTARSSSTKARREFRASLPGWAARDRFGIAYRHVEARRAGRAAAGPVAALRQGHLRARLEDGQPTRSCSARRSGPMRKRAARAFVQGDGRARRCRRGRRRHPARATARTIAARNAGDRGRRLVASAGAAARRRDPAGNRARLQHDAAGRRLRREAPADLLRPWLRRHAARDRPARRRRGRARRARRGRRTIARSKAMLEKAQAFLPGLDPTGGREWMGFRPSLPDFAAGHRPARATRRTSSTPSATAISA